jgi:hypothetical protein
MQILVAFNLLGCCCCYKPEWHEVWCEIRMLYFLFTYNSSRYKMFTGWWHDYYCLIDRFFKKLSVFEDLHSGYKQISKDLFCLIKWWLMSIFLF